MFIRSARSRVGAVAASALLMLMAAWGATASAQAFTLPEPARAYTDADPAASLYLEVSSAQPGLEEALNQAVRRSRNSDPVPLVQRALLYMVQGAHARAQRDLDRAFVAAQPESVGLRYAHWAQGWAYQSIGDHAAALRHWQAAAELHGGRPEWVPTTFALALWGLGAREHAVAFFAVAVNDRPGLWASEDAIGATTADWRANDRLTLLSVHNAWLATR